MNPPRRPSKYLEWGLTHKQRIIDQLSEHAVKARKDHHSQRKPIACGMTIHPAIGCSYGCLYCYVPDMGFPTPPRPYHLEPREIVAALALNPYFLPGPWGTLVAYGSVTEPFMSPPVSRLTLGYLEELGKHLGNPQQLSTKSAPGAEVAHQLAKLPGGPPSVLVSVTSLGLSRKLEPSAAPVEERLRWGALLIQLGVPTTLFLRPLIPGIPLEDVRSLLEKALKLGYRSVIVGSLRVTPRIIRRLAATGFDRGELEARLPRPHKSPGEQLTLRMRDVKESVVSMAREMGLRALPASCSANVIDHGLACWACSMGPCGHPNLLPPVDEDEVLESLEVLGFRAVWFNIGSIGSVFVKVRRIPRGRKLIDVATVLLSTVFKRRFVIKSGD